MSIFLIKEIGDKKITVTKLCKNCRKEFSVHRDFGAYCSSECEKTESTEEDILEINTKGTHETLE